MSNHIRRGSITLQNISFRQISTTSSLLQNAPESSSSSSSTINNRLNLPDSVNVIVVGGGIIGASVAYHLAKRGVQDVLLLERHKLTSGTTWHAAGLMVTFGSLSSTSTFMRKVRGKDDIIYYSTLINLVGAAHALFLFIYVL